MKTMPHTIRFLAALLSMLGASVPAMAAPLTSTQVAVTPGTVKTGQTVVLQSAIKAAEAVSNVSVTLEVHRVSAAGKVNSYAVYSKTLSGQNFAANETKAYQENYVIPATLISGTYALVIKAANADTSVIHLQAQGSTPPYTFTVNGKPDVGYVRGINIMDLGISAQSLPGEFGRHYTRPSLQSLQALKGRGLEVVRIPFKWERIQPVLGGELDTKYLEHLLEVLRDSNTAGLKVIVDMHNFGRYTPTTTPDRTAYALGDPKGATLAHFADAWKRIATAIRADEKAYQALYAYDLMNEPYNLVAGPPISYAKNVISAFDTGADRWTASWPATTSVAKTTRDERGALEVKGNAVTGSGLVFRIGLPAATRPLNAAKGTNLQFKGFVPESTAGGLKARTWMLDGNSTPIQSTPVTISRGEEFILNFAPPAEAWKDNKGIFIDFIVDNSDGFAPSIFYLDEVNQGTYSGGKSPQKVWEEYSQAAVMAIRSLNAPALIHVEGYDYSSALRWPQNHPTAWIKDPLGKTVYHAHQYMDNDASGAYKLSHAKELEMARKQGHASVAARAIDRYRRFTHWLAAHNVTGFIGEVGWPNAHMVGEEDAAAWNTDGEALFDFMDTFNLGATVWATGSWLPPTGNILNTYVLPEGGKKFLPLSQAQVLEAHPGNKK